MQGREKRLAVADDRLLVGSAEIEDVGALDFLELRKGFLQFQVRGVELSLVEIVVDGFAGDGVAESDFQMDEGPSESFTGIVVELSRCTFVFQIGKSDERHLRRAFDRHARCGGGENLVPLSRDHVVTSPDIEEAREEFGADISKCDGHLSAPYEITTQRALDILRNETGLLELTPTAHVPEFLPSFTGSVPINSSLFGNTATSGPVEVGSRWTSTTERSAAPLGNLTALNLFTLGVPVVLTMTTVSAPAASI